MKQVVFGIVSILVSMFLFVIMMTVYGRSMRSEEVKRSLADAMETAVKEAMEQQETITDEEMFAAVLLQRLVPQIDSTSDVEVRILDADIELGILSVEVVETYLHPNGSTGTVSQVRTVILDKKAAEEEQAYKQVCFYSADNVLYKEYSVAVNHTCLLPVPPTITGKKFKCWRFFEGTAVGKAASMEITDTGGTKNILALSRTKPYVVTEDTKLIAVYE